MFVHFRGSSASNPFTATDYFLLISHPAVADTLVLMQHPEGVLAYTRARVGLSQAKGRAILGAITINSNPVAIADEWQAHFIVSKPQYQLFERILAAQELAPCTLIDRFNGETDAKLVWLNTDRQYLTPWVMGRGWNLQFTAMEEL
jgi:hypothetical protein